MKDDSQEAMKIKVKHKAAAEINSHPRIVYIQPESQNVQINTPKHCLNCRSVWLKLPRAGPGCSVLAFQEGTQKGETKACTLAMPPEPVMSPVRNSPKETIRFLHNDIFQDKEKHPGVFQQ